MKLKLNIELNDEKYSVNAIKNDNKYIYNYKDSIITINKEEMTIKIHYENVINIMYLNKGYGIINIENKKIKYDFSIIKLVILNNLIEFIYKIDDIKRFVLEEVYE